MDTTTLDTRIDCKPEKSEGYWASRRQGNAGLSTNEHKHNRKRRKTPQSIRFASIGHRGAFGAAKPRRILVGVETFF